MKWVDRKMSMNVRFERADSDYAFLMFIFEIVRSSNISILRTTLNPYLLVLECIVVRKSKHLKSVEESTFFPTNVFLSQRSII